MRIENELVSRVALAWFSLRGIVVRDHLPGLGAAVAVRAKRLRELYSEPTAATPILASARALYRRLGIDPSKRRPSSEALLRRNLLFVVFAPAEETAEQLAGHRRLSIAILTEHVGGAES